MKRWLPTILMLLLLILQLCNNWYLRRKAHPASRYFEIKYSYTRGDTLQVFKNGAFMSAGAPDYDDIVTRIKNTAKTAISDYSIDELKEISLAAYKTDTANTILIYTDPSIIYTYTTLKN